MSTTARMHSRVTSSAKLSTPEAASRGELVVDEVEAPALVGKHRRGRPRADGAPSSPSTSDRQPFLAVKLLGLLAVDRDPIAPVQDVQPPVSPPYPTSRVKLKMDRTDAKGIPVRL